MLLEKNVFVYAFYVFIADIRDTVNYKEVMKQYGLGPNGGIVTALNLFSTKFGQVVDLVEKAGKKHKYCVIDTPGTISSYGCDFKQNSFYIIIIFYIQYWLKVNMNID